MKIATVIGARPQFIKAAVVSRIFSGIPEIDEVIIHTGQHYHSNMSDVFFKEMSIPRPDYNLGVNSLSHGAMTGRMLEKIEAVLIAEKPDWVLVYGDTNSTLAGALAAKKLHIKVAHVEAGLRSFNMAMPEEINRILTDRISDLLFCPTETAVENLKNEGFGGMDCRIVLSGDVMQDAALFYAGMAHCPEGIELPARYVLATVHRAENTDDPEALKAVFSALEEIARDCPVIFPLHPRTRAKLIENGLHPEKSSILFTEPVSYLEMVCLLQHCRMVMTDSGGVQKEAYFFGKYGIILRNETEWTELVANGYTLLAGNRKDGILSAYSEIKNKETEAFSGRLYGDGNAGKIIADCLSKYPASC